MSSVDNQQLNNIVQDAVIGALEQRLKDKDEEIEQLQALVNEMSNYFPACIGCEGKTTLGERTDKCIYEMDNTNYCTKRGITNIASIINENRELKAETDRLQKENTTLRNNNNTKAANIEYLSKIVTATDKVIVEAKAVKEFVERFENKLNCIPQHHFTLAQVLFDLNKTKKEMVGDK